jgi:hypothetical protein
MTQITSRQNIDQARTVVTFEEPGLVGWGVEVDGKLTIRGAMGTALVESMGGDSRAMAAHEASRLVRGILFDQGR